MSYSSYSEINTLEEFSFIAGSTWEIDFNVYATGGDGEPIELNGKVFEWRLSPYGEKEYTVVVKTEDPSGGITVPDIYTRRVTLNPSDTENLSGKFVHQIRIQDDGTLYIPAQGVITVISKVDEL